MSRILMVLCLMLVTGLVQETCAQQYLKLNYDCEQPRTAFVQVQVIDKRGQGQLLGYVQKGAFNRQEKIEFAGSLPDSLARFFRQEKAAARSDKKLVVILEDLFMNEKSGAFSEEGKVKLSVRFFVQAGDNRFAELLTLDSIFVCSGFDVTHKMLRSVSEHFCMLADSLDEHAGSGTSYSFEELQHLDSLEVLQIPVFAGKPAPGIYKSYNSFKMNTPDLPAEISIDTSRADRISVYRFEYDRKGRKKKMFMPKEPGIYAVSDGEHIVKYYNEGRYLVRKAGFGFYFDCPAMFSNEADTWGSAIGGVAGAAIASSIAARKARQYRYRINPRTGRSVPVMIVAE